MTDFGTDVSTFPDLDPGFALQTGTRVVAEAVARRLMTPRGVLAGAPHYGFDVRALVNDYVRNRDQARLQSAIETEAEADERVKRAAVQVTYDQPSQTMTVVVQIETDAGSFSLVLAVTAVSLTLLAVR